MERSLIKPIRYVSLNDPGIDQESPECEAQAIKYLETGDIALLPVKEGATLAVFELGHLDRQQGTRALGMPTDLEKATEALAFSLLSVSNFWGGPVKVEHSTVGGLKRVKASVLDALFGTDPASGKALFEELGAHILTGLKLRPTKR